MEILAQSSYLIIDDSNIIQSATRALLMKLGVPMNNIVSTASAKGAIAACSKRKFDILLIDHNLGAGSTGLQLLEYLHYKQLISPNALVFIVTGNDSQDVFFGYSQLEPDGYLIKPIRSEDIIKRVSSGLQRRTFCGTLQQAFGEGGLNQVKPLFSKAPDTMALKGGTLFVADMLRANHQYDKAQAMLAGLLQIHDYLPAKIKQVEILADQQQFRQAIEQLNNLIDENPFNVRLLGIKATLCTLSEQWELLEHTIQRHIQLHTSSLDQTLCLAWLYIIEQEIDKATPLLLKSAQLLPNSMWDSSGRRGLIAFTDLLACQKEKPQSLENWRLESAWARISKDPKSRITSKGTHKAIAAIKFLLIEEKEQAKEVLADITDKEITDTETGYLICWALNQLGDPSGIKRTIKIIDSLQLPASLTLARLQAIALGKFVKQEAISLPEPSA
ncbi:response regulator [Photobacterium sanctipauli]|uniref:Response regulator n=2 Tax=Photobacterium sanctipauli TaxID=1342794 RepID=A0A2T3NXT9_9GAMM|nr:response regulator [Photobacterium sanctipauli]PSW21060.1 response regulator [Photobacterium sanctipauli]